MQERENLERRLKLGIHWCKEPAGLRVYLEAVKGEKSTLLGEKNLLAISFISDLNMHDVIRLFKYNMKKQRDLFKLAIPVVFSN